MANYVCMRFFFFLQILDQRLKLLKLTKVNQLSTHQTTAIIKIYYYGYYRKLSCEYTITVYTHLQRGSISGQRQRKPQHGWWMVILLKDDFERQIFEELVNSIFYSLSEVSADKYQFHVSFCWRCLNRGLNCDLTSNKPIHYARFITLCGMYTKSTSLFLEHKSITQFTI